MYVSALLELVFVSRKTQQVCLLVLYIPIYLTKCDCKAVPRKFTYTPNDDEKW